MLTFQTRRTSITVLSTGKWCGSLLSSHIFPLLRWYLFSHFAAGAAVLRSWRARNMNRLICPIWRSSRQMSRRSHFQPLDHSELMTNHSGPDRPCLLCVLCDDSFSGREIRGTRLQSCSRSAGPLSHLAQLVIVERWQELIKELCMVYSRADVNPIYAVHQAATCERVYVLLLQFSHIL